MNVILSNTYVKERYVGLDIYHAKKTIAHDFPNFDENNIDIHYVESQYPRFTVLSGLYNEAYGVIELQASSGNPIRHLPSNFQTNDFLRGFLMIFQHIMNDTNLKLDNMHEYFRPMESPASFLPDLAAWLGIHLDTLGGEEEVRRFLQNAIPLYRYRGTSIGLRAHLKIVSGFTPVIIEGKIPYSAMTISDTAETASNLFDSSDDENSFTIHFPVPRITFDDILLRRLSLIVQREKPVHTKAYISFEETPKNERKITTMDEDLTMDIEGGISI